jgi:uncharacterized repeat protein (TIGR03803 family)
MLAGTLAAATSVAGAQAKGFSVLHSFASGSDGAYPEAGLLRDRAGNLYGTTANGGTSNDGTVFRLGADGKEKVLYSFGGSADDGADPLSSLIEDKAGSLYGTTKYGGTGNAGTVFRLGRNGSETVIYSFTGGSDGANPSAGLTRHAGKLYGTAQSGGASGRGVVFSLASDGTETVLYSFTGGDDGGTPFAGLIVDRADNLYGTTYEGGTYGQGTVFEISASGAESVLHAFTGGSDGGRPGAAVTADRDGNLYGTTLLGGADDSGTVFKLAPDGTETVLHSFTGSDGANPYCDLVLGAKGNLYGTTSISGIDAGGTVFKLAPDGTLSTLHTFTGAGGANPEAGLIEANGRLYGTTPISGAYGYGIVFGLKE